MLMRRPYNCQPPRGNRSVRAVHSGALAGLELLLPTLPPSPGLLTPSLPVRLVQDDGSGAGHVQGGGGAVYRYPDYGVAQVPVSRAHAPGLVANDEDCRAGEVVGGEIYFGFRAALQPH